MKLILCLLFLEFVYVQSLFDYYGKLSKYGYAKLSWSNHRNGGRNLYFILDLNDFKDEKYLYFKFTINNGYFLQSSMSYDYSDYLYTSDGESLGKTKIYDSYSYGTSYKSSYYDYYTYKFVIDKPSSYRYLYIANPSVYYDSSYGGSSYLEVENVSGFGLSVAVIVIIVIACIAIVAASIIVYFCRRARRASYIAPPVAEYQPPVATVTAYPPPTYY